MERHDDEKGETLTRDEMKHTKGGAKIAELDEGAKLTPKQILQEEKEAPLGGFEYDAKRPYPVER